jgi:hypothetical protein
MEINTELSPLSLADQLKISYHRAASKSLDLKVYFENVENGKNISKL